MKTLKKIKYLFVILLTVIALNTFAQGGPGDPGGDPEGGGDPLGGGAPISGGSIVLATIALAYGGLKVYKLRRVKHEEIK